MERMGRCGRLALAATAALAAAATGCGGDEPAPGGWAAYEAAPRGWSEHEDERRGYSVRVPDSWSVAQRSLTPSYTDPLEILAAATFPLRDGDELCGSALPRVAPAGALVTVQERGAGALGGTDFPPRPDSFRADPSLPGSSTWPYCAGKEPIPMQDYWFGFSDAGRAFHVLVAVGPSAPPELRRDAFRMLDTLRFDAGVKPDWRASG
jgi:hypothetical protein